MSDGEELELNASDDVGALDALADAVEQVEPGPDVKRALWRFKAGTPLWRYYMYAAQKHRQRRGRYLIRLPDGSTKDATYREWLQHNYSTPYLDGNGNPVLDSDGKPMTKGRVYNEQRKARRKEAADRMAAAGIQVRGRPKNPAVIAAVPVEMKQELNEEQLIVLGTPNMFENIADALPVPEDLWEYMGREELIIDKRPLNWPMFIFKTWAELETNTRSNYAANARLALKGDVGYILATRADYEDEPLVRQWLLYDKDADRYFDQIERDEAKEREALGEEDVIVVADEPVVEVEGKRKKRSRLIFTQNPIRIVEFMLHCRNGVGVDPYHIVRQLKDTSITMANSRASGLASCCYAWLRLALTRKEHKTAKFRKVLDWSIIFARFTTVAKKATGAAHSSQMTTQEKDANTVSWLVWNAAVKEFLRYYLDIKGEAVKVKALIKPRRKADHTPRKRLIQLDTGVLKEYDPKDVPPWWRKDYDNTARPPNLRELRDCAMAACYGLMAPIRLDWATTVLMDEAGFAAYIKKKKVALKTAVAEATAPTALKKTDELAEAAAKPVAKVSAFNLNVLVVDSLEKPKAILGAWFGQMKNKRYFAQLPVEKKIGEENSDSKLAVNVLLAYLQARAAVKFDSHCLFPYNTYNSEELKPDLREEGKKAVPFCFSNGAFGERLADFAWDLTGRNFTETLMRRSYITNYWSTHNALKEYNWTSLLQSVHQTSKSANLGYIKSYDDEFNAWVAKEKPTEARKQEYLREQEQRIKAKEGHDVDPEMDPAAVVEAREVAEDFSRNKKELSTLERDKRTTRAQAKANKEATGFLKAAEAAAPAPEPEAANPVVPVMPAAKQPARVAKAPVVATKAQPKPKAQQAKAKPKAKARKKRRNSFIDEDDSDGSGSYVP